METLLDLYHNQWANPLSSTNPTSLQCLYLWPQPYTSLTCIIAMDPKRSSCPYACLMSSFQQSIHNDCYKSQAKRFHFPTQDSQLLTIASQVKSEVLTTVSEAQGHSPPWILPLQLSWPVGHFSNIPGMCWLGRACSYYLGHYSPRNAHGSPPFCLEDFTWSSLVQWDQSWCIHKNPQLPQPCSAIPDCLFFLCFIFPFCLFIYLKHFLSE